MRVMILVIVMMLDAVHVERDAVHVEHDAVRVEHDAVHVEHDVVHVERDASVWDDHSFTITNGGLLHNCFKL